MIKAVVSEVVFSGVTPTHSISCRLRLKFQKYTTATIGSAIRKNTYLSAPYTALLLLAFCIMQILLLVLSF